MNLNSDSRASSKHLKEKMGNAVTQLKEGSRRRISHFTDERIAGKLTTMGVLPGSSLQVVRIAPFNGGYYLKVDGMNLALRTDEASNIMTVGEDIEIGN